MLAIVRKLNRALGGEIAAAAATMRGKRGQSGQSEHVRTNAGWHGGHVACDGPASGTHAGVWPPLGSCGLCTVGDDAEASSAFRAPMLD
jgi:hypothetical protein